MSATVEMPMWLVILVLVLAAIGALDRIIGPGLRWFLRRRMERAVEKLNERLERPIRPFRLMRRQDQVIRLIHDPQVMEAVAEYARSEGMPHNVAFARARSYAREIVPGFSTATYFGFAIRVARRLSQGLYRVRLGRGDDSTLRNIDERSAVVFVMNHRSNMDYVLVTWLAADRSALSYAVGEWAQVWPLKSLIRAMGAYFIRRRYSSPLYRAVLARYVQMSIQEGVTQAMFPEGGLSLNGAVGPARKGLLHYIVRDFQFGDGRDVVFVPVALNYDRVLEDRVLIQAAQEGRRRFRVRLGVAMGFAARVVWQKLRGTFRHFGYAAVCYGKPLSLREFMQTRPDASTEALAEVLMHRIRTAVPVLPVPLVAAVVAQAGGNLTRAALIARGEAMAAALQQKGAWLHLPGGGARQALEEGLEALLLRGILSREGGGGEETLHIAPGQEPALSFYAAAVLQRLAEASELADPADPPPEQHEMELPEAGET
ncbi:MAG: 1-acyl-sn-glycerol-3-phosphate acyltransferase [Pararhodobacter sp.]|nr:1-acyl-sn-glycerol-3-phosphate acyltransferase [Pararhodobacter sp.]